MPSACTAIETVPAADARRLLLAGAGLLADPARRAVPAVVRRIVEQLGYVQVDTINVARRAHDHILHARLDGYEPRMLTKLLERDRSLFEHWTHDASVIPTELFPYWKHRFARSEARGHSPTDWWAQRWNGRAEEHIAHVLGRIEREGPLMSRDFDHDGERGGGAWWGWKPQKAALEYLWRTGRLAIAGRVHFHKVYDLTERVLPEHHAAPMPNEREHVDWACRAALDRLGVATPTEIAAYLNAVPLAAARAWCADALTAGAVVEVLVAAEGEAPPRRAYAVPDWARRARRAPAPPARTRLLSPFDPIIRDRRRALRLFGFDYRFEAFVPAKKRRYGYYVLPVLEGDRLTGRLDAALDRAAGVLEVKGLWWEPGVKATAARRRGLADALDRYARGAGATRVRMPRAR